MEKFMTNPHCPKCGNWYCTKTYEGMGLLKCRIEYILVKCGQCGYSYTMECKDSNDG